MTRMRTIDIGGDDDNKNNNNNNEMTRTTRAQDKDTTIKKRTRTMRGDNDEG